MCQYPPISPPILPPPDQNVSSWEKSYSMPKGNSTCRHASKLSTDTVSLHLTKKRAVEGQLSLCFCVLLHYCVLIFFLLFFKHINNRLSLVCLYTNTFFLSMQWRNSFILSFWIKAFSVRVWLHHQRGEGYNCHQYTHQPWLDGLDKMYSFISDQNRRHTHEWRLLLISGIKAIEYTGKCTFRKKLNDSKLQLSSCLWHQNEIYKVIYKEICYWNSEKKYAYE